MLHSGMELTYNRLRRDLRIYTARQPRSYEAESNGVRLSVLQGEYGAEHHKIAIYAEPST